MAQTLKLGLLSLISFISLYLPAMVKAHRHPGSGSFQYPPYDSGKNTFTINVLDTVVVEWEANTDIQWLSLLCDQSSWLYQNVVGSETATYSPNVQSDVNRNWTDPLTCGFTLSREPPRRHPISGLWSVEGARVVIGPKISITSLQKTAATTFARTFTSTRSLTAVVPSQTSVKLLLPTYRPESLIEQARLMTFAKKESFSDTSNSNDGRVSAGLKVGIAIGAVFSVMLAFGLGFLCYREKRKIKSRDALWSETRNDEKTLYGVFVPQDGVHIESARYVVLPELNSGFRLPQEVARDKHGGIQVQWLSITL